MIVRFPDIVCHHILKGQHTLHIHISGACNQISLVGVLPCELVAYEMAPVIQVFAVNIIIFNGMPACRLHRTYTAALFYRHQIHAYIGIGTAASAQTVKTAVGFKGGYRKIRFIKFRLVVIDCNIRLSAVFRYL